MACDVRRSAGANPPLPLVLRAALLAACIATSSAAGTPPPPTHRSPTACLWVLLNTTLSAAPHHNPSSHQHLQKLSLTLLSARYLRGGSDGRCSHHAAPPPLVLPAAPAALEVYCVGRGGSHLVASKPLFDFSSSGGGLLDFRLRGGLPGVPSPSGGGHYHSSSNISHCWGPGLPEAEIVVLARTGGVFSEMGTPEDTLLGSIPLSSIADVADAADAATGFPGEEAEEEGRGRGRGGVGGSTTSRRAGHPLSGSADVKLDIIQEVGPPETQVTITFLSSGYTKAEEARFHEDVVRSWRTLEGSDPSVGIDPSPWDRYVTTLNIYSLFQESAESGASMPHGENHAMPQKRFCPTPSRCEPFNVANNLGCSYGTPHRKMLNCDWQRVMEVSSYAPPSDLVVVIVNHDVYGGTGDPGPPSAERRVGVATIYNGEDLPLLLVHEVGHAFGGLSDEYSYEVAEKRDLNLINCSPRQGAWEGWVQKGQADAVPVTPCSFTNYYRPTARSCLMGASFPRMCSVCKEQMTVSMYRKSVDMASPRCPLPAEIVVLTDSDEVTLRINNVFSAQEGVVVQWRIPEGLQHSHTLSELAATELLVRGSELPPGDHVITATTEDRSDFVLQKKPEMTTHSKFHLRKVVDSMVKGSSGCIERRCAGRGWEDTPYCSICDTDKGSCNITRTIIPRQREVDPGKTIGVAKSSVVTLGSIILGAVLGAEAVLAAALLLYRSRRVMVVVILTRNMKRLRHALTLLSLLTAVGSVSLMCTSLYYFEQAAIFGQPLLLAGIVLSGFILTLTLLLLAGSLMKVVSWLVVCGVLLGLLGVVSLGFGVILIWFSLNIKSESLRQDLQDAWNAKAASHPAEICTFQTLARCSGFTKSCSNIAGSVPPEFCPADCDIGNRAANSCYTRLEVFVRDIFQPAGGALIGGAVFIFVVCAATLLLARAILNRRNEMKRRRKRRLYGLGDIEAESSSDSSSDGDALAINMNHTSAKTVGHKSAAPLTDEEISALRTEFDKADKDRSGALSKREALLFWRTALDEDPTPIDIENASKAIDTNGDGKISFEEFVALYQPFDHRTAITNPRFAAGGPAINDPQVTGQVTPAEVKYLRRKFSSLDKGCGVLTSKQQLKVWFTALYARAPLDEEMDDFMSLMDPERTGRVDFKGFVIPYRELRRKKAATLREVLGDSELRSLRVQFGEINEGGDSILSTRMEFEGIYRAYHGTAGSSAEVEAFAHTLLQSSNGVVGFIDFCVPFARRVRRRKKMRDGLDAERIESIRAHYQLLEKDAQGSLTLEACRQLYSALYDDSPTERELSAFVAALDIEGTGRVQYDEVLRIFAETARMTCARRFLEGQHASDAEIESTLNDFLVHAEAEEGLRMGVPIDGYIALLRGVARQLNLVSPSTADLYAKFVEFDADGDGFLSELEFAKACLASVISAKRLVAKTSHTAFLGSGGVAGASGKAADNSSAFKLTGDSSAFGSGVGLGSRAGQALSLNPLHSGSSPR